MKIPFGKAYALTTAQLRDGIAQGLVDGYMDHDNSFRSRPGLTEIRDMGSDPIDGLYVDNANRLIIVTGGKVYVDYVLCSGSTLNAGTLCVFAEDTSYVYIAHGGRVAKLNPATCVVSLLETATAPDHVSHVVYCQGYLLANGSGGITGDTFYTGPYTSATYLSTWEVYNNESLPDGCLALGDDGQFVYNFGAKSVEIANNDGVTPWAKYSIGYIQYGIAAPYTLTKIDNTFFWLGVADGALRIMKMVSGSAKTVSTPFDAIINSMTSPADSYGFTAGISGHTFYVIQFPTDKMTLVYHLQQDAWYRWAYYDQGAADYRSFLGRCHVYEPSTNRNLIGSRLDGRVGNFAGFSDFGDNIRFELTSGNVKADTLRTKRASKMRFQLERGETENYTDTPVFTWAHRDDGGNWSPERRVSLGRKGNYNYIGELDRCGLYRERQHRIVFTETTCQLVLVEVEETTRLERQA